MLHRIRTVALNTYREAVRARILHGLMGLAVLTLGYSLVVGAYALHNQNRVVSDLGSAAISVYSLVVAVVLGATSLYRELDLKTIYPILARPMGRGEYLVGKFFGTFLTLFVFVLANSGLLLIALAVADSAVRSRALVPLGVLVALWFTSFFRWPRSRTWAPIPFSAAVLGIGVFSAASLVSESRIILGQACFTLLEVAVVCAVTLLFASFSTPFLTAVFSLATVVVGRSADTLASLPTKVFGPVLHDVGKALAWVFPNLMVYVPTRSFLLGEDVGVSLPQYWGWAFGQAVAWVLVLLGGAVLVFRRRDFL